MNSPRAILLAFLALAILVACEPQVTPVIEVQSPPSGERVYLHREVEIRSIARSTDGVAIVELYVNDVKIASQNTTDLTFDFHTVMRWTPTALGTARIMLKAYNRQGDVGQASIVVEVVNAPPPTATFIPPTAAPPTATSTKVPVPSITPIVQPTPTHTGVKPSDTPPPTATATHTATGVPPTISPTIPPTIPPTPTPTFPPLPTPTSTVIPAPRQVAVTLQNLVVVENSEPWACEPSELYLSFTIQLTSGSNVRPFNKIIPAPDPSGKINTFAIPDGGERMLNESLTADLLWPTDSLGVEIKMWELDDSEQLPCFNTNADSLGGVQMLFNPGENWETGNPYTLTSNLVNGQFRITFVIKLVQ
jgi:hypothetical protein